MTTVTDDEIRMIVFSSASGTLLCIASVKGGLVAAFFMHLKGERPWITYCLLMTAIFFFGLILLPLMMLLFTISGNAG